MGEEFTAKDFRTWGGTVSAIALLARTPLPESAAERPFKSALVEVVKAVADRLGNTPAVCRSSYIDPRVFEAWRAGRLHRAVPQEAVRVTRKFETIALSLLRKEPALAKFLKRRK